MIGLRPRASQALRGRWQNRPQYALTFAKEHVPEIGREFKPLAEVLEVDRTNASFAVIDPQAVGQMRPVTLADRHAQVDSLALPQSVPDGIRGYFDAARMLWVYGWLYYPFYTWASLHASICVEMALKQRFREDSVPLPKARRQFEGMLHEAVDRGWVLSDGMTRMRERYNNPDSMALREFMRRELGAEIFAPPPTPDEAVAELKTYLDNVRYLRNTAAHAEQHSYGLPNSGYVGLEIARDIIQQLYPATND